MASATLSALAGALLSPLRDVSLEKLIDYLWDHLSSSPSPSSSDEAEKQQQLKASLEALEDAKLTVRLMQSRVVKLFEKHKQNERVVGLHNKLKDVGYDIQDLESEMEYMELERKVKEINNADQEADTTTSRFSGKRLFPFRLPTAFLSKKKRRLPASSQFSSLSTGYSRCDVEFADEADLKAFDFAANGWLQNRFHIKTIVSSNWELVAAVKNGASHEAWRYKDQVSAIQNHLIAYGNPSVQAVPKSWIRAASAVATYGLSHHEVSCFHQGRDLPRWIMKILNSNGFT